MSNEEDWLSESESGDESEDEMKQTESEDEMKQTEIEPVVEPVLDKESSFEVNHSAQDLEFLLFVAFIFEKRTKDSNPDSDKVLLDLSTYLQKNNKINVDVDPCQAVILKLNSPDTPRIIDYINEYSPDFPLKMVFDDPSNVYIAKRLSIKSSSTYSYESNGVIDLPFFHGGKINIDGDVNFDSIIDLINSQSLLTLTSEITVSGNIVGLTLESVNKAMKSLRNAIYETPDEDIHGFLVKGSNTEQIYVEPIFIRKCVIKFSQNVLEVSRSQSSVK